MKITKRLALGTVLVGALALTGCAGSSDAPGPSENGSEGGDADLTVWFMRDDVPDSAQQWLKDTWAEQHDGAELTIEIQDWDGIVTKLQTTLASASQTPDLVEFGNTQVRTFAEVGALSDITDMTDEIGGDALIPALVDAGSVGDRLFAAPMFAGTRVVYYNKTMFADADLTMPTTLAELADDAIALKDANIGEVPDFDGIYLGAKDFGSALGWIFSHGSPIAEQDGDTWKGVLSEPAGIEALEDLQNIYENGMSTAATISIDEARQPYVAYNEGRTAMFSMLPSGFAKIDPELQKVTGSFALPSTVAGETGEALAGGSNLGIPALSPNQDLARELLKLTFEPEFQSAFASDAGWVPGNTDYAQPDEANPAAIAQGDAIKTAVMPPATSGWGIVESNDVIRDMLTELAQGDSPQDVAKKYDEIITDLLNG